ncbi:MAG: tetratricopeptide repeat protein [Deltaproteobacteria bacterium]|nr:tetratricopeptide repeat protein [Deltaproteobacteria bacterium]MCL4872780.1 tetratricopeptide repeat protein [bacterium]
MRRRNILAGAAAVAIASVIALGGCSKDEQAGPQNQNTAAEQAGAPHPPGNTMLIADLESRLKETPGSPDIMWRLADAYFEARQFEQAASYYKKVVDTGSGETDVYNGLGISLHYMGKSAEGLTFIEEGIKKNPYHQRIWLTKGFILAYGLGDMEGAKAAWEKATVLNPESQVGKAASEYLSALTNK